MNENVTPGQVQRFILQNLAGVVPVAAWGETAYFYNPGSRLKRGAYLATIKDKDGANDKGSKLDREGVWRLNMGIDPETFEGIFGRRPARPAKSAIIEGSWDFTELDALMPHPVYGWMGWVAVLNPRQPTWERCKQLLTNAHSRALATFENRVSRAKTDSSRVK